MTPPPPLTPEQQAAWKARQRGRTVAMGIALGGLAVLFYAVSIVKYL